MTEVGGWLNANGRTIYESELCQVRRSTYASFTRAGNTLYMQVHFWPGEYVALSGLRTRVKSAHLVNGGSEVKFTQDDFQTKLIGLPQKATDSPVTTIAIECESEPVQDTDYVRINKPRASV